MSAERTLVTARWVLPVTQRPIEHAGVLIDARGRIERVGLAAELTGIDARRIDLGNAAVLPGLVNVHAHPELAAFRGLLDDLPFHSWIPTLLRCRREASLGDDDYAVAARWTCVESLRAGITAMGATETSGAAVAACAEAGLRGTVFIETFGPAAAQVSESLAELRQKLERLSVSASDTVRLGVSPHAPYTVSDALYIATAALARSEKLPVALHAAEAAAEELLVREGAGPFAAGLRSRGIATPARGQSTIELMERLGVLACEPLLIHCLRVSADDLRRIADHGCTIAHCPIANARLGHGIAPIVEARALGIVVGIGTDSVASNNRLDVLEEARAAQIVQRARLRAVGPLPAADLLRMVTLDGARILRIEDRVGSLEAGKDADLCALSLDGAHAIPPGNIEDAVFHSARGSDVVLTMVQGRILYDGTCCATLNESELSERMSGIAARLTKAREQAV